MEAKRAWPKALRKSDGKTVSGEELRNAENRPRRAALTQDRETAASGAPRLRFEERDGWDACSRRGLRSTQTQRASVTHVPGFPPLQRPAASPFVAAAATQSTATAPANDPKTKLPVSIFRFIAFIAVVFRCSSLKTAAHFAGLVSFKNFSSFVGCPLPLGTR